MTKAQLEKKLKDQEAAFEAWKNLEGGSTLGHLALVDRVIRDLQILAANTGAKNSAAAQTFLNDIAEDASRDVTKFARDGFPA